MILNVADMMLPNEGLEDCLEGNKAKLLEPVIFETDAQVLSIQNTTTAGVMKLNLVLSEPVRVFIDAFEEWLIDQIKDKHRSWFSDSNVTMKSLIHESNGSDYLALPAISALTPVSHLQKGSSIVLTLRIGAIYVSDNSFRAVPEILSLREVTDCFDDGEILDTN